MTNEEIEKRLNNILKVVAFTSALEGSLDHSESIQNYTARDRVLAFPTIYDETRWMLDESFMWQIIEGCFLKVSLEDLRRFCKWVLGDE